MTSYFEISGHIVECSTDDSTSHPSFLSMVSVAERPERGRNSAMNEDVSPRTSAFSDPKLSFSEHWYKTAFHPLREFSKLSTRRQIGIVLNPRIGVPFGIQHGLEVVGMHYDYFLG